MRLTHSEIVRFSLRREMLLALMRLWDTSKPVLWMTEIAESLRDQHFFEALVAEHASGKGGYLRILGRVHPTGPNVGA